MKDLSRIGKQFTEPKYILNPAKFVIDEVKHQKKLREQSRVRNAPQQLQAVNTVSPQVVTVPKPAAPVPASNELSNYRKRQGQVIVNPFDQTIMVVQGLVLEDTEPPKLVALPSVKDIVKSGVANLSNSLLTNNGKITAVPATIVIERLTDGSDFYGPIRINFDFSTIEARSQLIIRGTAYASIDYQTADPAPFTFDFVAQPTEISGVVWIIPYYSVGGKNFASLGKLYKSTVPPIDRKLTVVVSGPEKTVVTVTPISKANLRQLMVNIPGMGN